MNFQDIFDKFFESESEPYPKIENIKQDYKFGKMLYDSYAGMYGELTAILQYTYEQITNREEKELSIILRKIAIDEMQHLNILGLLLCELGFEPYFMSSKNNKWCSDNVKCKFYNIEDMIKYNIKSEEKAIKEYCRLIDISDNKCIQKILARIMKDEKMHLEIFELLEKKYCK